MAFNHYAKLARILSAEAPGWYIRRINESTMAKTFSGETRTFDHYYRIYSRNGSPIKYAKFQQLDRLSHVLKIPIEELPIISD